MAQPAAEAPVSGGKTSEQPSTESPFLNHTGYFYLTAAEDALALEQLPVLLLLGVMSVIGVAGNALILRIYSTRFSSSSSSSTRTYILAMSVSDLLFCGLTLPGEILDLRFSLTYTASWLCRVHRFVSIFLALVSALILVAVALDRRRKVCLPFRPPTSTSRQVRVSVVSCIAAAAVLGFPFGVMNGHHSVGTEVKGIVGSACSVDDQFIDTSFPLVYNVVLMLIFVVSFCIMSFAYVQIARKIVRHKRRSMVGELSAAVSGIALLMGRHASNAHLDPQQSSSNLDGSSDLQVKRGKPGHFVRGNKPPPNTDNNAATDTDGDTPTPQRKSLPVSNIHQLELNPPLDSTHSCGRPIFESESTERGDFGTNVQALVRAVSENILHSSEFYIQPQIVTASTKKTRSASVGQLSIFPRRETFTESRPTSHPAKTKTPFLLLEPNGVKTTLDVKQSPTSPERTPNNSNDIIKQQKDGFDRKCRKKNAEETDLVEQNGSSKSYEVDEDATLGRITSSTTSITSKLGKKNDDNLNDSNPKNDDNPNKHVTLSKPSTERFHSELTNTLRRLKSKHQQSADGDVISTSLRRRPRHWGKSIPSRTTWMMFVLTAIFVISYLPYLILVCVRAISHDIEVGLHGWRLNLYTLGLKSYFINAIVNPVVYSFCSVKFRHQCRRLFRRCHP